jgi:hypothetical protein
MAVDNLPFFIMQAIQVDYYILTLYPHYMAMIKRFAISRQTRSMRFSICGIRTSTM